MKKRPVIYLIIGIIILIVPTLIYLCFLIPKLTDEYKILMASGGIIGAGGFYGASAIPEKLKGSGMYKLAANSFTILSIITVVQKFIYQIILLVGLFILCFIIFKIFIEVWKNARRKKENTELAEEIARNIVKSSE